MEKDIVYDVQYSSAHKLHLRSYIVRIVRCSCIKSLRKLFFWRFVFQLIACRFRWHTRQAQKGRALATGLTRPVPLIEFEKDVYSRQHKTSNFVFFSSNPTKKMEKETSIHSRQTSIICDAKKYSDKISIARKLMKCLVQSTCLQRTLCIARFVMSCGYRRVVTPRK